MGFHSYYEVLGVQPSASEDEMRAAFLAKLKKVHPDVNPSPDATSLTQALIEAYEVLRRPDSRRQYDEFLGSRQQVGVGSARGAAEEPAWGSWHEGGWSASVPSEFRTEAERRAAEDLEDLLRKYEVFKRRVERFERKVTNKSNSCFVAFMNGITALAVTAWLGNKFGPSIFPNPQDQPVLSLLAFLGTFIVVAFLTGQVWAWVLERIWVH